jgi:hypothetical protein
MSKPLDMTAAAKAARRAQQMRAASSRWRSNNREIVLEKDRIRKALRRNVIAQATKTQRAMASIAEIKGRKSFDKLMKKLLR